jgi:uncharacterized protein (TIGR00106 family)
MRDLLPGCMPGRVRVIVEIQCLPRPAGTSENRYEFIQAAIAVIQGSGLRFEVDALGTTIEGDPDRVWDVVRRVHEATLQAGAENCVSIVKVAQAREDQRQTGIDDLVGKFRG